MAGGMGGLTNFSAIADGIDREVEFFFLIIVFWNRI
jgi:hypothetical protein